MKERSYNHQSLKDYLLSALTAEQTERFDELSFTDEDFVQQLRVVEDDLVDAYVRGDLEAKLRTQFETRYLSSPFRQEKVALARALHDYGNESRKRVAQEPNRPWQLRVFFPQFLANRAWQWTVAAALLILMGVSGWLIFENRRVNEPREIVQGGSEQEPMASTRPTQTPQAEPTKPSAETTSQEKKKPEPGVIPEIASIFLAPQIRSGTAVPPLSLKPETTYVAVNLDLEPNEYSVYSVGLLRQTTGKVLWRANNLSSRKRNGDQTLNVRLPAALLRSESYVLRVSGLSQTGKSELISDYRFRVVK